MLLFLLFTSLQFVIRKSTTEEQKEKIVRRSRDLKTHQEQLTSLMVTNDEDFLRAYNHVMQDMISVLSIDDSTLLHTPASSEIPSFFQESIQGDLRKHGAVGGGPVPFGLILQKVPHQQCTLLQLSWALPDPPVTEVTQYEIQYEHIIVRRSGLFPIGPIEMPKSHPFVVPKSGKAQAHIMNDLYPSYHYRFRVRSRSIAGWGMWSSPVEGHFESFPVKISFTGDKVGLRIPTTGYYRITVAGAKAHDGLKYQGGLGATITATFYLQAHDRLEVAVGGMSELGPEGHSGGGGGTFVLLSNNGHPILENLLIAAGGGGGTRGYDERDEHGADASLTPDGINGRGREHGKGGKDGGPGEDADAVVFRGPCWGYGGAGFLLSSVTAKCYAEGLLGGQCGGFGGGGGVGLLGGGGGGGFSGGGGGRGGGGGGSYIKTGAIHVAKELGNDKEGYVIIEQTSIELVSKSPVAEEEQQQFHHPEIPKQPEIANQASDSEDASNGGFSNITSTSSSPTNTNVLHEN